MGLIRGALDLPALPNASRPTAERSMGHRDLLRPGIRRVFRLALRRHDDARADADAELDAYVEAEVDLSPIPVVTASAAGVR